MTRFLPKRDLRTDFVENHSTSPRDPNRMLGGNLAIHISLYIYTVPSIISYRVTIEGWSFVQTPSLFAAAIGCQQTQGP